MVVPHTKSSCAVCMPRPVVSTAIFCSITSLSVSDYILFFNQPRKMLILFSITWSFVFYCGQKTLLSSILAADVAKEVSGSAITFPFLPNSSKSCAGQCGLYKLQDYRDICQCDDLCSVSRDCCPDFWQECPEISHEDTGPKTVCSGYPSFPSGMFAIPVEFIALLTCCSYRWDGTGQYHCR